MTRYAVPVLLLAFGLVFQLSCGTEVEVTDDDKKLCLYANLMLNFTVSYEVTGNKSQTAEFVLPENVTSDESKCGGTSSTLKLNFGDGHSLSMNFSVNGKNYQADSITFTYSLSDSSLFNNSASNDTKTVTVKPQIADVVMDTCYSCNSKDLIQVDSVNMTLWNVLIQAFVKNGNKSETKTSCAADQPTTPSPPPPTTPVSTTTAPVTNTTSTAPPTTTPTPPLPNPKTGHYIVNSSGSACLLANFGLRIAYKEGEKYEEMNFETNGTTFSGSCKNETSELLLVSDSVNVSLTFISNSKKFNLHALNITGKMSSGVVFSEANINMTQWEASLGSSYMCVKEQNFTITEKLNIFTFDLHVQPFGVNKNTFSTAHECSMDDTTIIIPIIVGAALAGLIVIVVIAYVIGRRKTYVGYQTL